MNTAEIKLVIFNKLNFIDDKELLNKILNFISTEESLYFEFDEDQKSKVLKSLKKYETGKVLDSVVAEKEIDKWLKD